MSLLETLTRLSNEDFKSFSVKFFYTCDRRMTLGATAADYAFGGSLSYGWDWPTFGVYYPVMGQRWRDICAEAKRRGIGKFNYTLSEELKKKRPKGNYHG